MYVTLLGGDSLEGRSSVTLLPRVKPHCTRDTALLKDMTCVPRASRRENRSRWTGAGEARYLVHCERRLGRRPQSAAHADLSPTWGFSPGLRVHKYLSSSAARLQEREEEQRRELSEVRPSKPVFPLCFLLFPSSQHPSSRPAWGGFART